MLTLRKTKPGFGLELFDDTEAADPGAGEVTIRVEHAGICGSDVHVYEWTDGYGFMVPHLPVVMGHEFSGRIVAAGAGVSLAEGSAVTVMPLVSCGTCANCARRPTQLPATRRHWANAPWRVRPFRNRSGHQLPDAAGANRYRTWRVDGTAGRGV